MGVLVLLLSLVVSLPQSDGFCPLACECNEVALSVSCAASKLEVLPITLNPGIQRLQLQHNNIRAVDAALGFYAQLQYIDMSHNQLISLPDRGFIQQKKLIELRLSNNKIFKVTNSTFDGLKTVTILSLRKNFLEQLSAAVFSSLSMVEELDLGQNRIQSIDPAAFSGLEQLRVLYLDDNDLGSVPSLALHPLPHLAELDLALNNIKEHLTILQSLADHSFSPIVNLYSLSLRGCAILNISDLAFSGLQSLRVLDLSANSLNSVPTLQLRPLERLESLSLGKNYLTSLPRGSFTGLRKLRSLDLSDCPQLRSLEDGALANTDSLTSLSLSGCPELSLQPGVLLSLSQLTDLHLTDLGWKSVERDLVQWESLQTLDLSYNPLDCSCGLDWLREVMISVSNTSRAVCHSPARLAGRDLRTVRGEELTCGGGGPVYQSLVAGLCVLAGLATALLLVSLLHCHKKVSRVWRCYRQCQPCCPSDTCDKTDIRQTFSDNLYYTDRSSSFVSLPPADRTSQYPELYYPSTAVSPDKYYSSNTKSTLCEDDYFLSLSKDRKTFKPIRVCEL